MRPGSGAFLNHDTTYMDADDRKILTDWLEGPRDMTEGAALYRRYGSNLMLKQQFARERTPMALAMLANEIRKLAGLSELDMQRLRRRAAPPMPARPGHTASNEDPPKKIAEIPESEMRKIRFRERFTFLGSDGCPDVLKVLVADMFTAYGRFRESFAALQGGDLQRLMASECESAVESYIEDRMILDELSHYRDHGELLGLHPKVRATLRQDEDPDYMAMDVAELVRKLNSAQANVSKATAAIRKAVTDEKRAVAEERLDRWKNRLETIRAAIELRKKN